MDVRRTVALGTRPKGATLTDQMVEDLRSSDRRSVGGDDAVNVVEASKSHVILKLVSDFPM